MTERQYKDSGIGWIGKMPEYWHTKPVKFLSSHHIGGAWGEEKKDNAYDRYCVRIADFDYEHMQVCEEDVQTIRNYSPKEIESRALEYGDLIIEKSGGGEKTPVGRVVVYRGRNGLMFANFTDRFRLTSEYNVEFAKYVFFGWYNIKQSYLFFNQTTGLQNLDLSKFFGKLHLPVPPLEEQQNIADFLDSKTASIDSAIQAQKDIVEKLKEYKQSVITEAVTKGLNRDAEMKDSKTNGVDKIPATWEDMKIKYLGSFCNGLTYHPEDICGEDEGTLVLRSSNIQNGKLNFNDNVYVKCSIPTKIRVKKGDIIICSRNGSAKLIGKNALVTNDMNATFGAFMMMFRCDSPRYMYYVLNSKTWETYLSLFATTTINQLTSTTFGNLLFPYTFDKEEQCRIVEYLDSKTATIDKAIEQKNAIIEKLEEYKKSIIYNAVTGKIDCRKDVIPE